jgi:uncharacterized protein (DUF849 family)
VFVAADKLIIEVALNEQTSKARNPNVPITAEECAESALAAAAEGAAIVHFHARDPQSGREMVPGTEMYAETIRLVNAERPDLLVYVPYGFGPTPEARFAHIAELADDPAVRLNAAVIDPGTANFSFYDESEHRIVGDHPFTVTNEEFAYFLGLCDERRLQCNIVVREPGQVRLCVAAHRAGWTRGMLMLKIHLGDHWLWGVPPSDVAYDVFTSLVPDDIPYTWMSYTNGPSHWPMTQVAIERGAHVRVGIGDHAVDDDGVPRTNADAVRRVVELATDAGRAPATPDEARAFLRVAQPA